MEQFCARATNHKQSLIINSAPSGCPVAQTSWPEHVTRLQQKSGYHTQLTGKRTVKNDSCLRHYVFDTKGTLDTQLFSFQHTSTTRSDQHRDVVVPTHCSGLEACRFQRSLRKKVVMAHVPRQGQRHSTGRLASITDHAVLDYTDNLSSVSNSFLF